MKALYCTVFGQRVKITTEEYPFMDFLVSWTVQNEQPVITVHPNATEPENHTLLLIGLHHDLFEIACWLRGIYESETESFMGFGHEFWVEAHGKTLISALKLYEKITSSVGRKKGHLTIVKG